MEELGITTGRLVLAGIAAFIIFWGLIWNKLRKKKQWDNKLKPVYLSAGITAIGVLVVVIFIKFAINREVSKPPTKQIALNFELAGNSQLEIIKEIVKSTASVRKKIYCVKSPDHTSVYFVGGWIMDNSGHEDIAIWAMYGTKESPGITWSVNKFARKISGLIPFAPNTKARISMRDKAAEELKYYIDKRYNDR